MNMYEQLSKLLSAVLERYAARQLDIPFGIACLFPTVGAALESRKLHDLRIAYGLFVNAVLDCIPSLRRQDEA